MIVTVMSDASFCHTTKCSGWGVWVKSERGLFEGGGNFRTRATEAAHAEAMAISIAVWVAFRQGIALPGDEILVQTDCLRVIHHYEGKNSFGSKTSEIAKTIAFTKNIIAENKATLRIRHVKAHAKKLGKRNYVNDLCDKHAKKAMKAQRAKEFPETYPNGNSLAHEARKKKWEERVQQKYGEKK